MLNKEFNSQEVRLLGRYVARQLGSQAVRQLGGQTAIGSQAARQLGSQAVRLLDSQGARRYAVTQLGSYEVTQLGSQASAGFSSELLYVCTRRTVDEFMQNRLYSQLGFYFIQHCFTCCHSHCSMLNECWGCIHCWNVFSNRKRLLGLIQ